MYGIIAKWARRTSPGAEYRRMDQREYICFMLEAGFPKREAAKMADYALLDFDSFDEAAAYYAHSEKFWQGLAYAGHRKARRIFRKN